MSVNKNDEIPLIKAVLLGESGVGKTSIISSFVSKTFSSILMTTPGATHVSKTIVLPEDKKEIKFEIWDTAGQEKFRSLAKIFYKNAAVIILVYDITRKDTFNELKKFWYNEVRTNASEKVCTIILHNTLIVLALVGNKGDMYQYEEVKENEGKAYAKSINALYKTTSAKSASKIDELFELLARKKLNPQYVDLSTLNNQEMKEVNDRIKIQKISHDKEITTKNNCKC